MFKKQLAEIVHILQDSKIDWSHRFDALQKLCIIAQQVQGDQVFINQINKYFPIINNQILDLRSKVSSKACQFVVTCAKIFGKHFQIFSDKLISKQSLLKLLSNGNKVLAEYANQTIKQILINCKSDRFLPKILSEFIQSKNTYVRQEISNYLQIIITTYSEDIILSQFINLQKSILCGIIDSAAKVRKNIRNAFYALMTRFPKQSKLLLKKFESSTVKIIQQQYKDYQQNNEQENRKNIQREQSLSNESISLQKKRKGSILKETDKNIVNQLYNNFCYRQSNSVDAKIYSLKKSREKPTDIRQKREPKIVNSDWRTQDLQFLLLKTENENWATRLTSFQKIFTILSEAQKNTHELDNKMIEKIIEKFVSHLQDSHIKITRYIIQCFQFIILNYEEICGQYAHLIMKRCIKGIAQSKEKDFSSFKNVLQILKEYYIEYLFHHLTQHIEQVKVNRQRSVALDFAIEILQQNIEVFQLKNLNYTIKLMANLIVQHFKDKNISIPALAIISIIKEYQSMNVLICLHSLSQNVLNKILELAAQIQPELEQSILKYIESMRDQSFQIKKSAIPKSNPKIKMNLVGFNYEQQLKNKALSNELIFYICQRVKQGETIYIKDLSNILLENHNLTKNSYLKVFQVLNFITNQQQLININTVLETLSQNFNRPYLQAINTAIQSGIHIQIYLRRLNNILNHSNSTQINQISDLIIQPLIKQVRSKQAQIRRLCIISLADIVILTGQRQFFSEMTSNEQRLVELYIERRKKLKK